MSEMGYGNYSGASYSNGNNGSTYGNGYGGAFTSTAGILVLFILLVIISKAFFSY